MALGSDSRLGGSPRMSTTMAPPSKPPAAAAQPAGRAMRFSGAPQIDDSAVANYANDRMAAAAGAGREAVSGMDRAGVSRGKGRQYYSDIATAAADADARSDVAKMTMSVAQQNAASRQAYDNMKSNERLNTEGLLESLRSSQANERLAKQGWSQDLYEAMRRGQFGLDQIRLDMSPLWQRLFS